MKRLFTPSLFVLCLVFFSVKSVSQCVYYPLSLEQRVGNSKYIALGKVTEQHTYIDNTGSVNTLNKFEVTAWLKNQNVRESVYIITLGGVYGNMATQVDPALQLTLNQEYILMLEEENKKIDDKSFQIQHPDIIQMLTYSDAQGCLVNMNNFYTGLFSTTPESEKIVFEKISALTGQVAKKPSGAIFQARPIITPSANKIEAITSFSPTTTRAGTIVPGDQITISGSGFGAAAGTVFFTNADDGGATFTSSGVASDIISWTDASITVKVASAAGTGPINVNGAFTSGGNLTVDYAHIAINNIFNGFGTSTRQRYYHRNMNGAGGYTFEYNSGMFGNAPAVAAFERALATWRCNTGINWRSSTTPTAISTAVLDGSNVILFDPTLSAGLLGQAVSRFTGSGNGACMMANTVWCVNEIDVRFAVDPPVAGFPWQYGPAAPTGSQFDFESVALHELGHGHGLGHVINAGQVMHFSLSNGASSRTLSANDIAGANARIAYSTVATCLNPGACGTGPMTTIGAGACLTLPLLLTNFSGERTTPAIDHLQWTTAQEESSKGFYIQRGSTERRFSDVGYVAAVGNSNQATYYTFPDRNAGPYAWYYRLRMVDIDGKETFSPTIFIDGDKTSQWRVWSDDSGDKIYIYGNITGDSKAQLTVYAMNGQQVLTKTITSSNEQVEVGQLSKGLYHYQLLYGGKKMTGKLLLGK